MVNRYISILIITMTFIISAEDFEKNKNYLFHINDKDTVINASGQVCENPIGFRRNAWAFTIVGVASLALSTYFWSEKNKDDKEYLETGEYQGSSSYLGAYFLTGSGIGALLAGTFFHVSTAIKMREFNRCKNNYVEVSILFKHSF